MTPDFIRAEIQWRLEGPAPSRNPIAGWVRGLWTRVRKGVARG